MATASPPLPAAPAAAPPFERLLLTGAAGGLGRVLRPRLKRLCRVLRASDIAAMDAAGVGEEVVVAALEDAAAVHALVAGVQAIVHLGGVSVEGPCFYFDRYGIETVCLRIGSSFPEPKDRRMLATWLSYDDLERLVTAALSTPVVGHSIVYGLSDNATSWWDNRAANHLGYRPADSSEPFRAAVEARQPSLDPGDPATLFQGGGFVTKGPYD